MENNKSELKNKLVNLFRYAATEDKANEAAEKLIDCYECNKTMFDINAEVMAKSLKISEHMCLLMKMIPDLARAYEEDKSKDVVYLKTKSQWETYFKIKLLGANKERMFIAGVDQNSKLLGCLEVSAGESQRVVISVDKVMQFIITTQPTAVAIAHNHPGGLAKPSYNDIMTTRYLQQATRQFNIEFIEHFIIVRGKRACRIVDGFIKKDI